MVHTPPSHALAPSRQLRRATLLSILLSILLSTLPPLTPTLGAALAKWLENKRLREQRLAQRRQYGAIRMNPVLVSAVEVKAPDALSPPPSDAGSVRGSVSFDGGLPALVGVGVGVGGGGGRGGGGGGGVGMGQQHQHQQQQQRGKQRFSGRPKPQPDPLPKRVVVANASGRRMNAVGSGPSASPSLTAASRSKAAAAATPRHLQPMTNAPEPPLRELPPALQVCSQLRPPATHCV